MGMLADRWMMRVAQKSAGAFAVAPAPVEAKEPTRLERSGPGRGAVASPEAMRAAGWIGDYSRDSRGRIVPDIVPLGMDR